MAFGGQGLDYCQLAENQREEIKRQNGDGMKTNIKLRRSQQAPSPVPPESLMLPANAFNARLFVVTWRSVWGIQTSERDVDQWVTADCAVKRRSVPFQGIAGADSVTGGWHSTPVEDVGKKRGTLRKCLVRNAHFVRSVSG